MRPNRATLRAQAATILAQLRQRHPQAHCELDHTNALELLVATVLSAQCTDVRVNQVTATLFRTYRAPADYLRVPQAELEADIRPTGFFRRKAESIRGIAQAVLDRHGGEVPGTMDALAALPGVGRKTANVVLGAVFGVPGIVVDTHVTRVSQRLGLTRQTDPEKIEADLMALYPPEQWVTLSHTLVFHGRYVCAARQPRCTDCPVTDTCAFFRQARTRRRAAR